MDVTDEMLEAAVKKATEAGIFRRNCSSAEWALNMQVMQSILQAAFDTRDGDLREQVVLPRLLMKSPAGRMRNRH